MEENRSNFIWDAIEQDLAEGRYQEIHTRFPPEPNGYMHIGHCKALIMDFLTAEKYGGKCNLRFDDTNPAKEDTEYVENIKKDIQILGVTGTMEGTESITAQAKTVTPSAEAQTVTSDAGYDYLSQVTVAAISFVATENAAGGYTAAIA